MNIGIMQLSNISISSKPTAKSQGSATSTQTAEKTNSFGDVFNKVINASSKTEQTTVKESKIESVDVEKLDDLLNSQSIEEVLDLLGIPQDEGLLMLQDGQAVATEELMNLDSLLAVLGIEQAQLVETIKQLTGSEMEGSQDLWQLINEVLGQDTEIVQQLITALQGEQKVTPKQAEELLQFLKLAQVSGKNTDLFSGQAATLDQLNNMLKNVAAQASTQITQTTENKVSLQGFELVVQKIVKTTTETVEKTETADTNKATVVPTTSVTNATKTITITLPTEKGAQSEALAKEMQNLLNRSQISSTPGMTKLLLKLYPENLGSIRIEIMQQDGVLSARLLTTTAMGKELLDSQLNQLKNAFANANIQMDRIDIAQSLQETDRNKEQNQFGQQFKQQSKQQEHEQDDHEEESEKLSFSDYLINEEV
ncbi:flagellar hook-length control protein FliK [Ureibacillus chungkukjangi]|uniref:Flagellar hook-length control protein FliK n=1 Tax=Ureibacillus chungkukjangi TaxID=1202712 RepID=A0A318U5C0_9BACL|nr:flagellar hook-length control protein FliK [Ureibacillus chungkukjangi]PYF07109.1 flagellar hook-length control protein FliK [Ureibacillus chungkukjangi]